jgi:hypothetical protein
VNIRYSSFAPSSAIVLNQRDLCLLENPDAIVVVVANPPLRVKQCVPKETIHHRARIAALLSVARLSWRDDTASAAT